MKKLSILITLFFSLLSPQVMAELKIGFVNAVQIMDSAPQVEEANSRLEQEFAPRQKKLVNDQKKIKEMEERLAKDSSIMSASESMKLSREARDKGRELQREQEEFREDYSIRRNEELDKLQKKLIQVIQTLAKEEKFDLILSEGVVWASPQVDITDKVLERLKKER